MARSYRCWQCGQTVAAAEVQRSNVITGGVRGYQRRVNLCPACDATRQRRNIAINLVILAGVAAFVIFVLVSR